MTKYFYNTDIEVDDELVPTTIEYCYTPGDPGVRYDKDGSGYPPTGPEIDVQSVVVEPEYTYLINKVASKVEDLLSGYTSLFEDMCEYAEDHDVWED